MNYGNKHFQVFDVSERCISIDGSSDSDLFDEVETFFQNTPAKAVYLMSDCDVVGVLSKRDFLKVGSSKKITLKFPEAMLTYGTNDRAGLLKKFNSIPVQDKDGKIIRILERVEESGFFVCDKKFKKFENILTIAEIGNNHNGCLNSCKSLIQSAASAGVKAAKLQMRNLDELYVSVDDDFLRETDYGTAYTVRQLKKFNLTYEQMSEAIAEIKTAGLIYLYAFHIQ